MPRIFRPGQWWLRLIIGITVLIGMIWLSQKVYSQEVKFKGTLEPSYGGKLFSADGLSLIVIPEVVYRGDLIVFEIRGADKNLSNLRLEFDGRKIKTFWHKDRFIGLGAAGLNPETNPAKIVLEVSTEQDGNKDYYRASAMLGIKPRVWSERHVGETSPLNPSKMARYLKEKALIKKALGTTADEPLWQAQFSPAMVLMEETSPFGQKRIGPTKTRQHRGVDLRASVGTPVRSMNSGRVVLTGNFLADGKIVIIDHGAGLHTLYLHLSRIKVKQGQIVKRGQVLGLSGNTGFSEGQHLHLEVRLNGEPVDPLQILEILK